MKGTGKRKKLRTALFIAAGAAAGLAIWFGIPYSPLRDGFGKDIKRITADSRYHTDGGIITEEAIGHLPEAVKKCIRHCGFIGTPVMSYMKMGFHDVAFSMGKDKPTLNIDYTLYDFTAEPCRMAFIDSSMFGVPFQGYDYYENGSGGMKGVLAKAFTVVNETGSSMDKACLVTYLSESMCAPSILLRNDITFEETDEHNVRAEMTYAGQTADGVFTFNDEYEMISFTSDDRRTETDADGNEHFIPWTVKCGGYKAAENGVLLPAKMQIVWNYPDGDLVYFDGEVGSIVYG